MGKRMAKGRRMIYHARFGFNMILSLIVLLPLHTMMTTLFKESMQDEPQVRCNETCIKANNIMGKMCKIMTASTLDAKGHGSLLHRASVQSSDRQKQDILRYIRKEVLRICGSFVMRTIMALHHDPLLKVLARVAFTPETNAVTEVLDSCSRKPCCVPESAQAFEAL